LANTFAPQGFQAIARLNGAAPTFGMSPARISKSNATAIYFGDPVTQLNTGYITQSTAGTTQIHGIFAGCQYLSTAFGKTVWSRYWPGTTDAAADVAAYIIDDPLTVFAVQSGNGGPCVLANIGTNINFALGTGNTSNGISGAYADFSTLATTSTLPFRIVNIGGNSGYATGFGPPAIVGNGSDGTTAYNTIYVTFNNQDYKSLTGI
jgi:hypothetical protein